MQLTICDPACGSGAFLNQALDFLIAEHRYIEELQAKLFGDSFVLSDVEKSILENNIFGVDLNEESVEIAKLSLWLRTAQPNRTLNNLNDNIKCGNSLIDDPAIAGDKAFNWQQAFPHVFEKGGFDVVIGNPPYVLCQPSNTDEITLNYYKSFEVASYKIDLFHLFYEKAINILKTDGKLGFITPNTFLTNKYIQSLRNFILRNTFVETIVNYNEIVFIDAGVDVVTIVLKKCKKSNNEIKILNSINSNLIFHTIKSQSVWYENHEQTFNINIDSKLNFPNCIEFKDIGNTYFGIQAYDRKSSIFYYKSEDSFIPIIDGADIFRYHNSSPVKYFNFKEFNIKSGGDPFVYEKDRIVIRQIGHFPIIGYCEKGILTSNTIYNLYITNVDYHLKYIFVVLNSSLIKLYWLSKYSDNKDLFPKIKGYQIKQLPIPIISTEAQQPFIEKADLMLSLNKELQEATRKFQRTIQRKFEIEYLSTKLQNWYSITYKEFISELGKKKIKLTLTQEAEWEEYFLAEQTKAMAIKNQIDATDKEIDQMVYNLYELTPEEIEIIEKGV